MSRTVNEALKIALSKVRPLNRKGFIDGGDVSTGEPRTVPEKPETIRMQLRQLANGKRAGVFVARGTKGVTLPEGMRVVRTQEGNIIFDPTVISKEEIETAVQSGRLNELLGYVQSKPEALAQSLELGELPNLVVSRDKNGVEQDSAAVSPDRAEEQAEVFEDRARGGSTVSVEPLHDGVLRDRMAEGGVPDEESQEKFLKEQLEGSLPQEDKEAGLKTLKEAGLMAAGFVPGSGVAAAAGKFPTAEGGFEPSAKEDWQAGRYGSAALKAAGAAGDVLSAIPVAGTAAGALLKAPLAAKLAMAAAPMAKVAKEAAPAVKAAEETRTFFHGSPAKFSKFDLAKSPEGIHLTSDENLAREYAGKETPNIYKVTAKYAPEQIMSSSELIENQPIFSRLKDSPVDITQPYTGERFFQKLSSTMGPEAATEYLRKAGVQGMSYPAKGHFSFYDPSILKIEAPEYKRLVNPAGFYSRAHEAAMTELPEGERTWQEMHSLLSKAPRVQKEELYWSGIHPETFDPKQKVTREQIGEMIEKNFPKVSPVEKSTATPKHITELEAIKNEAKSTAEPVYEELKKAIPDDDIRRAVVSRLWDAETPEEYISQVAPQYQDILRTYHDAAKPYFEADKNLSRAQEAHRSGAMRPMHEQYTVPGGENYNERILTHEYNDPNRSYVDPEIENKYADEMSRLKEQRSALLQEQKDLFENNPAADPDVMIRKINANTEDMRDLQRKIKEESRARLPETPGYAQNKFRHEAHLGDINNPILHTRNSERNIPGRGKVWHQEEVQSDWAQQGREKGFKDPVEIKKAEARHNEIMDEKAAIDKQYAEQHGSSWQNNPDIVSKYLEQTQALSDEENKLEQMLSSPGLPSSPHVRDTEHWLDLAAKDTLKNAIEGGHDHIFITGGQEQAKRWANELRKAVDNVRWEGGPDALHNIAVANAERKYPQVAQEMFGMPMFHLTEDQQYAVGMEALGREQQKLEGTRLVYAKPVGSDTEHRFVVKQVEGPNGKPRVEVVDSSIPSAKGETLSAVVGGDLAKRIMSEESGEQAMKGYRMGSEGYSQTYERKYPSSFKKLLKSLDPEAKIEAGQLPLLNKQRREEINDFVEDLTFHETEDLLSQYGVRSTNELAPEQRADFDRDLRRIIDDGVRSEFGEEGQKVLRGEETEGVHGTWIEITPKMRAEYNRLKQKHGAVFPAYERGGTVDAKSNSRYTGADRRLLERALHLTRKLTE